MPLGVITAVPNSGSWEDLMPQKNLGRVSVPKLAVIVEVGKDRIGPCRLHQGEQPPEHCIDWSGRMPDIKINGVKRVSQVPFRVVVEAAAVETFIAVRDGP